ncbi:hypothetical protein CERSUDRAFT_98131 [Gelatoporia subvermispora B]|uniref:Velvet domain-containing protein n=1 Tax=Ceriporiopsis subvermispora (strain B) TaxID=914234 RepID=M2QN15_CERS8|nr:hypothetical protein CERSUDRAFT_98131 [Gelatoporia subvermispora B]
MLAGTTVKDSSTIPLYGKNSTIFVFSDVAVRREGTFFMRYRVFYMFSQAVGSRQNPVIAECFGQPFKIYSTKDFPGLLASTDLTKARTNVRSHERKRRRTTKYASTIASSSPQIEAATGDELQVSRRRIDPGGPSDENEDQDRDDVDESHDEESLVSPSLGASYDY